jgi:hypothetical protein
MTNIGTVDRGVRVLVGLVLIALSFLPPSAPVLAGLGPWRWALVALGGVLIATAAMRFCPAYTLLGVNTGARQ